MTRSGFMEHLFRVLRAPFMPVLLHIDRRVQGLFAKLSALELRIDQQEAQIVEQGQRFHCDAQAILQTGAFVERSADELTGTVRIMEGTQEALQALIQQKTSEHGPLWANHLLAHDGPIGKAGLWFNPPVVLNITEQGVEVDQIHERILEVPFVHRVLAGLAVGDRILDAGCAESTLAFSLAALGFQVQAIDPRGYPLSHPNLRIIPEDISTWGGPGEGMLDAVVCLSSLEHFGLNAYDASSRDAEMDRWAMRQFLVWLRKGGRLVMTAPYGRAAVSDFERVYGAAELDALLEGWDVKERVVYARHGKTEWRPVEETLEPWPAGLRGVVLVHAEKI